MPPKKVTGLHGLQAAFDEVRFGAAKTLNLRASLPTAADAAARTEAWLRQQQVERAGEVLIVTGRGNNSEDGISRVREAAIRTFHELRRKGVIDEFSEHTAGSFVVRLAPVKTLMEVANRRRAQTPVPPPATPATLAALSRETMDALRVLAERSLLFLGVKDRAAAIVEAEMMALFGRLARPEGDEKTLRKAIEAAMDEYD